MCHGGLWPSRGQWAGCRVQSVGGEFIPFTVLLKGLTSGSKEGKVFLSDSEFVSRPRHADMAALVSCNLHQGGVSHPNCTP